MVGMEENRKTKDGDGHGETPVERQEKRNGHFVIRIPYWLCGLGTLLSILVGIVAVLVVAVSWRSKPNIAEWMLEVQERAGKGGVNLFKSYDMNRDGYLSIFEFEHIIPHLKNVSSSLEEVMQMETYLEYSPKDGEEVVVLYTNFTPLQMETMTNVLKELLAFDITGEDPLYGLSSWKEPIRNHTVFGASEFQSFLPEDMEDIPLGKPYRIVSAGKTHAFMVPTMEDSSIRFYPPVPKGKEGVLFRLLGMMHRHPFVHMRFQPRGMVACVRAFSDKYVHIVFRMHAEFQLNEPPLKPFWFTPAQFVGDLVMTRDGSHVQYFHMRVPNERRLNVDMEWLSEETEGEDGMIADIGYMPLMEWTTKQPSHLPLSKEEEDDAQSEKGPESIPPSPSSLLQRPDQIEWSSEVPRDEVLRLIEIEFFPFKTVTYHNLTRAVQLSEEQNKPLHAIFLWGALDDQSC